MKKQQRYGIVCDLENRFHVVDKLSDQFVHDSTSGKEGLEDCEDWIAKQPEE